MLLPQLVMKRASGHILDVYMTRLVRYALEFLLRQTIINASIKVELIKAKTLPDFDNNSNNNNNNNEQANEQWQRQRQGSEIGEKDKIWPKAEKLNPNSVRSKNKRKWERERHRLGPAGCDKKLVELQRGRWVVD